MFDMLGTRIHPGWNKENVMKWKSLTFDDQGWNKVTGLKEMKGIQIFETLLALAEINGVWGCLVNLQFNFTFGYCKY